ncbi:MAG TPA: cysteine--tRNA ligase [Halanaerobiales bacterium]|nr:cysteine--tRNA ligase [Halanaerobiales bacterium]
MLKVYNTLTREKEEFVPVEKNKVKMYVCGLTVQNYSHLGHMRGVINYDVIRNYLEYKGYEVKYISNFTDINEKIIARAELEDMEPMALAHKYSKAFLEDLDNLNIKRADHYCKATENIDNIIEMVQTLVDKGFAYVTDGNVYFSVEEFADYGKLSGRNLDEMIAGTRKKVESDKKNPLDFALWKKVDDQDVMAWDSPWGRGWPGWHIECSAMSIQELGSTFDIHGGGTDLIFPHHENEIAQAEAYSGVKPFVKYWMHNGTVNMSGDKMSKSLGNFYTTRELLEKYTADQLRYFILTKHYRSPIEYNEEEIESTNKSLEKLINTKKALDNILKGKYDFVEEEVEVDLLDKVQKKEKEFFAAMDDDFNTALASGVINEIATEINKVINDSDFKLSRELFKDLEKVYNIYTKLTDLFGLTLEGAQVEVESEKFNDLVEYILSLREEARENKNYELADKIRDDLAEMGIKVNDTPRGTEWEITN